MIDCLILGDSIATGVAQFRPECVMYAEKGISSRNWNNKFIMKELSANTVIVSLGSNDGDGFNSFKELLSLRQSIRAETVYWILPANKPVVREQIKIISKGFEDLILTIPEVSKDNVHPTFSSYKKLADNTRKKNAVY